MSLVDTIKEWLQKGGDYKLGIAYLYGTQQYNALAARLEKKETAQNRLELKVALRKYVQAQENSEKANNLMRFLTTATGKTDAYHLSDAEKKNLAANNISRTINARSTIPNTAAQRRATAKAKSGGCGGCGKK